METIRGSAAPEPRVVLSKGMTERGVRHSIEEWLAQPPSRRLELLDGEFVEKAAPDVPHALSQSGILRQLALPFQRKPSESWPGGWWILPEVDLKLGANGFRPDVSGWRRERAPVPPTGRPVTLRPDWICEVLSDSNRAHDTVNKLRWYHEAGVPHYWLLDPAAGALNVFRHELSGYLHLLTAHRPQRVRAEPFDAIEISVGELLGDDPE